MTKQELSVDLIAFTHFLVLGKREDNPLEDVRRFCKTYDLRLLKEGTTTERGFRELLYFFNDNLGGYTIDAIRESLK